MAPKRVDECDYCTVNFEHVIDSDHSVIELQVLAALPKYVEIEKISDISEEMGREILRDALRRLKENNIFNSRIENFVENSYLDNSIREGGFFTACIESTEDDLDCVFFQLKDHDAFYWEHEDYLYNELLEEE